MGKKTGTVDWKTTKIARACIYGISFRPCMRRPVDRLSSPCLPCCLFIETVGYENMCSSFWGGVRAAGWPLNTTPVTRTRETEFAAAAFGSKAVRVCVWKVVHGPKGITMHFRAVNTMNIHHSDFVNVVVWRKGSHRSLQQKVSELVLSNIWAWFPNPNLIF